MRSGTHDASIHNLAREFTARLAALLRRERDAAAEFVCALAEFDRARLWQDLGYASLFDFLHRELRMSAGAAHYRKVAVELVQRFPECVEPLRDGRLCITAVPALARVITSENARDVLPRFFHLSRRGAQSEAAAIAPAARPPQRGVVTALKLEKAATAVVYLNSPGLPRIASAAPAGGVTDPIVAPAQATSNVAGVALQAGRGEGNSCSPAPEPPSSAPGPTREASHDGAPGAAPSHPSPDAAEPLDAELSRLHVTVTRAFLRKLEAARDALSHARPGASMADILEAGLDLVLARRDGRRGLVDRPRGPCAEPVAASAANVTSPTKATERSPGCIPAAVKRAAWKRAGGRCQWPIESGGTCGSTVRLELDHIVPRALGGPSTLENIRVLCREHNGIAARRVFGDAWMDQFTRRGGARRRAPGEGGPAP